MRSQDFLTAVGIGVADLEKSKAFYRDVLGMQHVRDFKVEYMDEVMLAHEGRNAVVLMHYNDGSERNYRDNPVKLVFYVTDPAAIAARVKASGQEVTHEPTANANMGGALICMARDPDGYVIELIQRPARAEAGSEAASVG
jgi:catechol 2,3-dioxygenase-like lactoylglutathione lyase family enzyme